MTTGLLILPVSAAPAPRPPIAVVVSFDRDTYQVGDTARLTILLTNYGLDEVTVTARCEPIPNGVRGPLADELSIPAGTTRTVVVTEPVPEAAAKFGYLSAESCAFTAPPYPSGEKATRARAKVPGQPGSGRGRIFQDLNGNAQVDDGEPLAGTTVVVTHPDTGAVVARPVTDERGGFVIDGVPAMMYALRVPGPWTVQHKSPGWFELPVVAGNAVEQDYAVMPGPEEENNKPNLVVTATFDKTTYKSGDEVRATVTIANVGEVAAEGVRGGLGDKGPMVFFEGLPFEEFDHDGPGVHIEAGASRTVAVAGSILDPSTGGVMLSGSFSPANGDINVMNNDFRVGAPVTETRGTLTGTVYGDRNDNKVMDAGEALGRTDILLYGDGARGEYRQQAGPDGRFTFRDLPSGRYLAQYRIPGGWVVLKEYVWIGDGISDILIRATRPISETLTASIVFTKDAYTVGETANLVVTLTNTGSRVLAGITATCADDLSVGHEISSDNPGWGDLAENGPGVTINPGETRTFSVSSVVPELTFAAGYVLANCRFGIGPLTAPDSRATARAVAKVPGGIGTSDGFLVYDRDSDEKYDGDGVANTPVTIIDPITNSAVSTVVTDADGRFLFKDVPANRYQFRVDGPWKLRDHDDLFVTSATTTQSYMFVVPGPLPPDPNASPQVPPQPQGGVAPRAKALAKTGANVLELSVWGFAVLLAGVALLFVRRRDARQS